MANQEENKRKGITFREIIGGDFLTRQSLVRQMPFFFFIVVLFFIQISMIYYFESVQIEMKRTKERVKSIFINSLNLPELSKNRALKGTYLRIKNRNETIVCQSK